MSLLKYIERLKRMDDLIRRRATGSPDEFADKLGISQSQLFQDLKELKELGAPVCYCQITRSYEYTRDCRVILDFGKNRVYGGRNFLLQLDEQHYHRPTESLNFI